MSGRRGAARRGAAVLAAAALVSGCDDQVKYVPWFSTMVQTPAIETYEEEPRTPPEGSVAVDALRDYTLAEADSLLVNPLAASDEVLERGEVLYRQFCISCHGETGVGDGPVVGQNRLPPLPTLNLLSDRAKNELSDGYIWGMIANGRGVMPAYARVPREDRWLVVEYVRSLQRAHDAGQPADGGAP